MIQKLGHRFVKASTNLDGSANERLSRMIQNRIQLKDTSMEERIASLVNSKELMPTPESVVKTETIIPENSINYLA